MSDPVAQYLAARGKADPVADYLHAKRRRSSPADANNQPTDDELSAAEGVRGTIDNVRATFLSGVPLANRARAGLQSLGADETQEGALAEQKARVQRVEQKHPVGALGLQVASGIALPFGPLKAAAKGASWLPRVARTGGNLTVSGAAQGANAADLHDANVGGGAALGAAAGLAIGGAFSAGAKGLSLVRRKSAVSAALEQAERLAANKGGVDAIRHDVATRRAAGGNPMAFEVMGDRGESALRASTNAPWSEGDSVARTALGKRSSRILPRSEDAVRRATGIPNEPVVPPGAMIDRMTEQRKTATAPLYAKAQEEGRAYQPPVPKVEVVEEIDEPVVKSLRLDSGRLRGNLRHVSDDEIETELERLRYRQTDDEARWRSHYEHPDTEAALQLKDAGNYEDAMGLMDPQRHKESAFLRTQWNQRQKTLAKLEAEVKRRQAAVREMERSTDDGDASFEFGANAPQEVGAAMKFYDRLVAENPLVRRIVNETRELPDLMDKPHNSFDVMDEAYKSINARIKDARASNDNALAARLDKVRKPMLEALTEIAPTYHEAATSFADHSTPVNSFQAGQAFRTLSPYDIEKALTSGKLSNGYTVEAEPFKVGVAQELIELLQSKSASPDLAGAANAKNPLNGLNNASLAAQLRAALGRQYDAMIPTFVELLKEEAAKGRVLGGSNTAKKLADETPDPMATALSAMVGGGLGFGMQAAARRGLGGLAKGTWEKMGAGTAGKAATESARTLTSSGDDLDNLMRMIESRQRGRPAQPVPYRNTYGGVGLRALLHGTPHTEHR